MWTWPSHCLSWCCKTSNLLLSAYCGKLSPQRLQFMSADRHIGINGTIMCRAASPVYVFVYVSRLPRRSAADTNRTMEKKSLAKALFHAEYFFTHSRSEMIGISAQHAAEPLPVCVVLFLTEHTLHTYRQAALLYVLQTVTDGYANINKQRLGRTDRQTHI